MMMPLCLFLALFCLVLFLLSLRRNKKLTRDLKHAEAQLNHFLLYPEASPEKFLEEGAVYNLMNQVYELEAQYLHEKNLQTQKDIQVTRFLEDMAHQMKTAVTALQIRLDLAWVKAQTEEEKQALSESQKCVTRLTQEIQRLLTSSLLASGKVLMNFEELNLTALILDCTCHLKEIARKRRVTFQVDSVSDCMYYGDSFWLSQAFENIIKNAAEHTRKNNAVKITLQPSASCVQISIVDYGKGISPEELPLLFQRFCRGNTSKTGYGIGLNMAQDIIKAHHGSLTASNHEQGGACFTVSLPLLWGSAPYKNVRESERRL